MKKSKHNKKDDAVTKLAADLDKAKQDIDELTETSKRALADLQNARKRMEQEKEAFGKFANASLILEILPVLDNFDRAMNHAPENITESDWFKGLVQVEQQLRGVLNKFGCTQIEDPIGKPVNANIHEALMKGPGPQDTVTEVLETGYQLGDKVIRPAKVKVGDGS